MQRIMKYLEKMGFGARNPLNHLKKFEIVKGDATKTIFEYLDRNKETIIALAYFDFDVYETTKVCLEAIKDLLVKGSVIGFDEMNDPDSPGETQAVMEVFGLNNIRLKRFPQTSRCSYFYIIGKDNKNMLDHETQKFFEENCLITGGTGMIGRKLLLPVPS